MTRQTWTAIVSGVIFVVLAAVMSLTPVPFVAWGPGSTYDVLGRSGDRPFIEIAGEATTQPTGSLRLTTVSVTSVDSRLSLPEAVLSYLRQYHDVLPRDSVYPVGQSIERVQRDEETRMATSQRSAIVAGLQAAGRPVTQVPQVVSVVVSGPSYLRLEVGDFIEAVDGIPVTSRAEVDAAIRRHAIGDRVQLDVRRSNSVLQVSVTTVASNDDPQVPRIGVELTNGYRYDTNVTFNMTGGVVGSSAGLVLALGVYDLLTTDDLTGGRSIAGTGEISPDGTVGVIGGVREKIKAAKDAGATIFLLPAANCTDVQQQETDITLVRVTNLSDAIASLTALRDNPETAEVPRC